MPNANNILSRHDDRRVVEAIRQAEQDTSGEIKVHIDNRCKGPLEARCVALFGKLRLHETKMRNGVLFYVAIKDRKFAVLGDEGIDEKVGEGFWDDIKDSVIAAFREGRFADGLVDGILRCGEKLKAFFPVRPDDANEISNEISYGDE